MRAAPIQDEGVSMQTSLSDPDEFRDFEMQRIERLPVGVVRPRKV